VDLDKPITCLAADSDLMREPLTAGLLTDPNVRLLEVAQDGTALLDLIARRQPDAVVADVDLHGIDGLGVCRVVAERHPRVRVILCGGEDDYELLEAALDAGASGFVLKSGEPDDLARALHFAIRSQVYIAHALVEGLLQRRGEQRRPPFSGRERQVLGLLAEGHTSDEIAARLLLTADAVRSCASRAMEKLDAADRRDLIARSLRLGVRR
jgi:DNA-binding NarL/FixJ family response regulator